MSFCCLLQLFRFFLAVLRMELYYYLKCTHIHTSLRVLHQFGTLSYFELDFFKKTFPSLICIIFWSSDLFSFSSYLWISLYLLSIESCSFLLLYWNLTILIPVSFFCMCVSGREQGIQDEVRGFYVLQRLLGKNYFQSISIPAGHNLLHVIDTLCLWK